jgi:uncharacterized membrane protein HdeD (DUF308 family)
MKRSLDMNPSTPTDGDRSMPHPPVSPIAWGWLLAYAILTLIIGLVALLNPVATGLATGLLMGVSLLFYGAFAIVAGVSSLAGRARWLEILLGVLALVASVVVLLNPFAGALSLVWAIGAWLLLIGVLEVVAAFKASQDRGWRLFLGAMDLLLGAYLLFTGPAAGLIFLAVVFGLSFLLRGVFLVALALGLRRLAKA